MVALVAFILACALILGEGIEKGAVRGYERLGAELAIVPEKAEIHSMDGLYGGTLANFLPQGIEEQIGAMPGVIKVAPQYVLKSAADSCCEMGNLLLVGFDPSRDFTVLPWLPPGTRFAGGKDQAVVGWRVMKAPGGRFRLYDHTITVAARLERTGTATSDAALFIPLESFAEIERSSARGGARAGTQWGRPSLLLVRLSPGIVPREAGQELERKFRGMRAVALPDQLREKKERLANLARVRHPLAVTAWLFALLAGGAVQFLSMRERRASLGLLRSFGFGKKVVLGLSAVEAFVISLAGIAAGSIGAYLALRLTGQYLAMATGIPLLTSEISLATANFPRLWTEFATAMAIVAVINVFPLLQREPADLLRGE
jgi:hypothetical protein